MSADLQHEKNNSLIEPSTFEPVCLRFPGTTLSQTVRALETRLGVRLLNRTARSVAPTDAGERLLTQLRPLLDRFDAAIESVNAFREKPGPPAWRRSCPHRHRIRTGLFEPKSPLRKNRIFRAETKRPKRLWKFKDAGAETKSR